MNIPQLLKDQSRAVQRDILSLLADIDDEAANWRPNDRQFGVGIMFLHAVNTSDIAVHAVVGADPVILRPELREELGGGRHSADFDLRSEWAPLSVGPDNFGVTTGPLSVDALRRYAQEVFDSMDRALDGVSEQDLFREVQLPSFGPRLPVYRALSVCAVTHLSEHSGEVSCLKGLLGLTGM